MLKRALPYEGETEPRWDIPGGRINTGETLHDALAREIKEETGLTLIGEPKILFAQDILRVNTRHVVRLTYKAQVEPGTILLDMSDPNGTHHDAYKWVSLEEMNSIYCDKYLEPVLPLL